MPNGREHLKYEDFGGHSYLAQEGTSDCSNNCGCWAGPTMSGGPAGVDPLGAKCPGNPLKKIFGLGNEELTQKEIYNDFINARINYLSQELYKLQPFKLLVDTATKGTKIKLQEEVIELKREVVKLKCKVGSMKEIANKTIREISSI